jgi:hypothetical protein
MLAMHDIVSCRLPFFTMQVTDLFSVCSQVRQVRKLVFYPLFSITSQVWDDASRADILSPCV